MGGGYAPNDIGKPAPAYEKLLVKSPASIANLGPGFDVLALAIEGPHDKVYVEVSDEPGIVVEAEGAPSGRKNSAYAVAEYILSKYCPNCGVRIKVSKGVPVSAGLGSSGATSAAVAYAINELYGLGLSLEEMLEASVEGEYLVSGTRHYDNVAASLMGGLVVVGKRAGLGVVKLSPPRVWLGVVVIASEKEGKTGLARSLLPKQLSLEDAVTQASALATLLAAAHLNDAVLFGRAVSVDLVAEPARKSMIPLYDELKAKALSNGALGFNISGAGPSVFAVHQEKGEAEKTASELAQYLLSNGVKAEPLVVKPSEEGVVIVDSD